MHELRGGHVSSVDGRLELRQMRSGLVLCFWGERVRLLPGGYLPDRGRSVGVHELRSWVCVEHGGRLDGKCVRSMRSWQLLCDGHERVLELHVGPVLGRICKCMHDVRCGHLPGDK